MTKTCTTCELEKDIEDFYLINKDKNYRKNKCKSCVAIYQKEYYNRDPERLREKWSTASKKYYTTDRRRNKTLKTYGLTNEDYNNLFELQNGQCKICDQTLKLVVDHDHLTGDIRGLLCNMCNVGLGHFSDDPERLHRAIKYLSCGWEVG